MSRLLLAGVFLEIGAVLLVVPWMRIWDANYFLALVPRLQPFVANPFVRGAVSGLGVINLVAGIVELTELIVATRVPARSARPPQASEE